MGESTQVEVPDSPQRTEKLTCLLLPRPEVSSTKKLSQSSLPGPKPREDSTRRSRSLKSKRKEPEELLESKRPLLVCPLTRSREREPRMLPPETRNLRKPKRKSRPETPKSSKRRKPLKLRTRLTPNRPLLLRTFQSKKSTRAERDELLCWFSQWPICTSEFISKSDALELVPYFSRQ